MSRYVSEPDVRQFLLKNLSRTENGFEWKINIGGIDKNIEQIGSALEYEGTYDGPTLFVKGARSNYYRPGDEDLIKKIFIKLHGMFKIGNMARLINNTKY